MNLRSVIIFFVTCLFMVFVPLAMCDETITLSVQPKSGSTADTFLFGITINNPTGKSQPILMESDDFSAKYVGPQQSVQITNGFMQNSITYFYRLTPTHSGSLLTPKVTVKGVEVENPQIMVKVTEGDAPPEETDDSNEVLFDQQISSSEVYRGEQVLNTLEIATKLELHKLNVPDAPLTSFWAEDFKPDEKDQVVKNRETFSVLRLRRALFPLRSGSLNVPARRFSALAHRSRMDSLLHNFDPFDPNFMGTILNGGNEEVQRTAKPLILTVKELPSLPASLPVWGGGDPLVGETSITVAASKFHLQEGEALDVIVRIESYGNLNPLSEAPWGDQKKWKIYQDRVKTEKRLEGGKILFTKEFRYSFVPTTGGNLIVPALSLGYFEPAAKVYKTTKSEPIQITVEGAIVPTKEEVDELVSNISDPETSLVTEQAEDVPFAARPWKLWALILAAGLAVTALLKGLPARFGTKATEMTQIPQPRLSPDSVVSMRSLYATFVEGIRAHFPHAQHSQSIRAVLKESLLDSPLRFEIESTLDELEESLFGSERTITEEEFQRLKSTAFEILSRWGLVDGH